MKLYVDDQRPTPPGWIRAYNAHEAIELLKTKRVLQLSLDYDLGNEAESPTGYDVLLWLEETLSEDKEFPIPNISIHDDISNDPGLNLVMNLAILSIKQSKKDESKNS